MRTFKVSIFVVKSHTSCIPRGAWRRKLIEQKHLVQVELRRNMSPNQVRAAISKSVVHLSMSIKFILLDCVGHRLVVASDQEPDGETIIDNASKRKGAVVYICPEIKVSKYNSGRREGIIIVES